MGADAKLNASVIFHLINEVTIGLIDSYSASIINRLNLSHKQSGLLGSKYCVSYLLFYSVKLGLRTNAVGHHCI